jgi:hypothetical protein
MIGSVYQTSVQPCNKQLLIEEQPHQEAAPVVCFRAMPHSACSPQSTQDTVKSPASNSERTSQQALESILSRLYDI